MNAKDAEYIRKLLEDFHFKEVQTDLWQCGEFVIERKEEPYVMRRDEGRLKKLKMEKFYLSQHVCIPSMDRDEQDYWDSIKMGSFASLRDAMRKAFMEAVNQLFRANDADEEFIASMDDVFRSLKK